MTGARTCRSVEDKSSGFFLFPVNESSMTNRQRQSSDMAAKAILGVLQFFSIKPVTYEIRLDRFKTIYDETKMVGPYSYRGPS